MVSEDMTSISKTWPGVICAGSKKLPPPIRLPARAPKVSFITAEIH